MESTDAKKLPIQVPILCVRGTHYQVGYSIGKTFGSLIKDFFNEYEDFEVETLPHYQTAEGKQIYGTSLGAVQRRYPLYVREIQGMADGANIPFENLFLLHIENLFEPYEPEPRNKDEGSQGCTSIITNTEDTLLLGHTEDALKQMKNKFYIISAEILSDDGSTVLEKFTTLTYPGYLPGGTMGFNSHGIVHSINSIFPVDTFPQRTSHLFIMRAILGVRNMDELVQVLEDDGSGTNDGFSLNVIFGNGINGNGEDEPPRAYNIEICPNQNGKSLSDLYIKEVEPGHSAAHCNKYLRCQVPQKVWPGSSSNERHETLRKFTTPYRIDTTRNILSAEILENGKAAKHSIYKKALDPDEYYATISVGIFDLRAKEWYLYTDKPQTSSPIATIPMIFSK